MPAFPGRLGSEASRALQEGRPGDVCNPLLAGGEVEGEPYLPEREPVTAGGPQSFLAALEVAVRQGPPWSRSRYPGQHPLAPDMASKV